MSDMAVKRELNFRVIVKEPLAGVTYAVQRGKADLLAPAHSSKGELTFEFALTLADIDANPPRLTGEFAQGPANKRFVYVNTGTMAGQKNSPWTRRAKVPLYGINRSMLAKLVEAERGDLVLEARIRGIGKDYGPACATIPFLSEWSVVGAKCCGCDSRQTRV